jgi:glycosyl transferase family 11
LPKSWWEVIDGNRRIADAAWKQLYRFLWANRRWKSRETCSEADVIGPPAAQSSLQLAEPIGRQSSDISRKRPSLERGIPGMRTTIDVVASCPIVVVTLRGGLGNQMFQYAIGRTIAEKQSRMLVLDDLALEVDHPERTKRRYELFAFEIQAALTSQTQINRNGIRAMIVQDRRGFHEDAIKPNSFPHLELHGFWQSENYFAEISGLLRDHFRMRPGPWNASPWQAQIAAAGNPVCIHVRRQDYLYPDTSLQFVGREYYQNAVAMMKRDIPDCHFFIFSDDLPWCRENLRLDHPHSFVEHGKNHSDLTHVDFKLMTMCRHFIIANSSYSWWPAWLGTDPQKLVIAPMAWFADIPSDSTHIPPNNWLRL